MKWRILTDDCVFRLEVQDVDGHPFVDVFPGREFHSLGECQAYRDSRIGMHASGRTWRVVEEIESA